MSTTQPTVPYENAAGEKNGRSIVMVSPNPRRSPPRTATVRDVKQTQDGRKRQKLNHSPVKGSSDDEVPRLLRPCISHESASSDQSASKWYSAANKNPASEPRRPSQSDDDTPFYMTDHLDYVPPSFAASEDARRFGNLSRIDSENEDLRGVIDDLTLENKRLKQMIRSQRSSRRGTPGELDEQEDKLFEVRMHGLPPEKRRELEYLLKNFATSVHTSLPSKTAGTSSLSASATSADQKVSGMKRQNSQTDSGYISNSNAGSNSNAAAQDSAPVSTTTNNRAVRNYLQDIPDVLFPRKNPVMSERAKQALVVRRLEQLFTGRNAGPGHHDQPMQQQEISVSAARDDRMLDARNSRKRKADGTREAHIMPPDTKVNLDAFDSPNPKVASPLRLRREASSSNASSRPASPEQRPTRPLDLDIFRAQGAAESIHYIRHLGLDFPQLGVAPNAGEESPWMFLNLLAGLAQLHTLNVTPEFVCRAVKKLSTTMEVSTDGHRIRWVGGARATKFTAEDEKAIETAEFTPQESIDEADTSKSSKRSQTNSTSNAPVTAGTSLGENPSGLQTSHESKQQHTTSGTSMLQSSANVIKSSTVGSAFDYKPILFRQKSRIENDDGQDSDECADSSSGGSSGLVQALSRSNLTQQNKEEGLITFFSNPYFCSDFSKENAPLNMRSLRPVIVGETLGVPVPVIESESPLRHHDATYFTTQFAPKPFDAEALSSDQKARFNAALPKLPTLALLDEAGEEETMPLDFEVCGLGGVTPKDNFALDVKVAMKRAVFQEEAVIKQLPFSRRQYLQKYSTKTKLCRKIELIPSRLPPPSYVFFTSSSSSDADDVEDDSDESDSSSSPLVDEEYPAPPAFLQRFACSSQENLADDEDDDDTNSSEIDMLAVARRTNPQEIAEQERMYMINQLGGVNRAAAGSLAATIGASMSSSCATDVAEEVHTTSLNTADRGEDDDEYMRGA